MQFKVSKRLGIISLALLVMGFSALSLSHPSVSAESPRSGDLDVTKTCSEYTGAAGDFCTITASNLAAIPVGSRIVYTSAFDGVLNRLDSDVVLHAGPANTAFGHCYVNGATGTGTCLFSGGTGKFTWFHAIVAVSSNAGSDPWVWDGEYSFSPLD